MRFAFVTFFFDNFSLNHKNQIDWRQGQYCILGLNTMWCSISKVILYLFRPHLVLIFVVKFLFVELLAVELLIKSRLLFDTYISEVLWNFNIYLVCKLRKYF